MNKAIFLDRDGVIIKDLHYLIDPSKIIFEDGIVDFIKYFQDDYYIIIITNQSGVARGFFTLKQVDEFNNILAKKLNNMGAIIHDVFVCPHHKDGVVKEFSHNCECRKPKPGMIFQAKEKYNLDLSKCFLIGNAETDLLCGQNANLKNSFMFPKLSFDEIKKQIISET